MKNIIIILLFMLVNNFAFANNLNIGSTSFNAANKTVSFTISWDNSWRVTTGPSNWDAVWVFIKRQACSSTNIWASALLSTTSADHTTAIGSGTNLLTVDATSDGMGVFIRRSALTTATGSIGIHTITLKLNASSTTNPTIITGDNDNFKVMGLEMVYVPQGSFYLGDGRATNSGNFSAGSVANTALLIDAAKQNAGLGIATVYTSNFIYGAPSALPASFPIGYNGFYCMKYELGVSAYLDFINSLDYDQQAQKLKKWSTTAFPNILNADITRGNANSIKVSVPGTFNTIPATFVQSSISYYKPIHELNWQDLASYLDWSGLRPMTEFEFEKACRGNNAGTPNNPVANEYPWGSTQITPAQTSNNNGTINELIYAAGNNGVCQYNYYESYHSPMRSGSPATATSNRVQAGATYYGIMEMGGNVYEQCVGGGNGYDYSAFTSINGDGSLTNLGLANVTGWPTYGGASSGTILRGGGFNGNNSNYVQVSDRTFLAGSSLNGEGFNTNGTNAVGGRGVRTMSY